MCRQNKKKSTILTWHELEAILCPIRKLKLKVANVDK